MARIAGMNAADATDAMTAALHGFNMELNEGSAKRINDVYSKLAAVTASDTQEISTAMTKTASLAHNAGMDVETTSAYLAKAIEATREAPENIGTALKTIIARFQEIKKNPLATLSDESGEYSYNKVDTALQSIGIQMKKTNGDFKPLGQTFNEISSKWDSLSQAQQRYVATQAAGSRQQSRFIALMSDYGKTQELLNDAYNSEGAGQEQFEKTLDSLDSKLNRLQNAWDQFITTIVPRNLFAGVVDGLTDVLTVVNNLTDAFGPLSNVAKATVGVLAFKGIGKLTTKAIGGIAGMMLDKTGLRKKTAAGMSDAGEEGAQAQSQAYAKDDSLVRVLRWRAKEAKQAFAQEMKDGGDSLSFDDLFKNMDKLGSAKNEFLNKTSGFTTALTENIKNEIKSKFPSIGDEMAEELSQAFSKDLGKMTPTDAFAKLKDNIKNSLKLDESVFGSIDFDKIQKRMTQSFEAKGTWEGAGEKAIQDLKNGLSGISDIGEEEGRQFAQQFVQGVQSGKSSSEIVGGIVRNLNANRAKSTEDFGDGKADSSTLDTYAKGLDRVSGSMGKLGDKGQDLAIILDAIGFEKASSAVDKFSMILTSLGDLMAGVLTKIAALPGALSALKGGFMAAATGATTLSTEMAAGAEGASLLGTALGSVWPLLAAGAVIAGAFAIKQAVSAAHTKELNDRIKEGSKVTSDYNKAMSTSKKNTESIKNMSKEYGDALDKIKEKQKTGGEVDSTTLSNYNKQVEKISKMSDKFSLIYGEGGRAQILYNGKVLEGNGLLQKALSLQEQSAKAAEKKYQSEESYAKIIKGSNAKFQKYSEKNNVDSALDTAAITGQVTTPEGPSVQKMGANVTDLINATLQDYTGNNKRKINPNDLKFEDIRDIAKTSDAITGNIKNNGSMFGLDENGVKTATKSIKTIKDAYSELEKDSADSTKWLQQHVESTFTSLADAPTGFVNSLNSSIKDISMEGVFNDDLEGAKERVDSLASSLSQTWEQNGQKIKSTMEDVQKAQEQFDDTGNVEQYNAKIKDATKTLGDFRDAAKEAGNTDLAEYFQEQIDSIKTYEEHIKTLSEVFNQFSSEIGSGEKMGENFKKSIKDSSDYYTAVDSIKTVYDEIIDKKDNVGRGSKTFWAGARELLDNSYLEKNINNFDAVNKKIQSMGTELEGGRKGAMAFYKALTQLNAKQLKDSGIEKLSDGRLKFSQTDKQFENMAKYLGQSTEVSAALLNNMRQFSNLTFTDVKELPKSIQKGTEALNSNTSTYAKDGGAIANYNTLRSKAQEADPQAYFSEGKGSKFQTDVIDVLTKSGASVVNLQKDSAKKIIDATNKQTQGVINNGKVTAEAFVRAYSGSGAFDQGEVASGLETLRKSGKLYSENGDKVTTTSQIDQIQKENTVTNDPILSTTKSIDSNVGRVVSLLSSNNGEVTDKDMTAVKNANVEGSLNTANTYMEQAKKGEMRPEKASDLKASNDKSITQLQGIYNKLSKAGQESAYGKEIKASIDKLKQSNDTLASANQKNADMQKKNLVDAVTKGQRLSETIAKGLASKKFDGSAQVSMDDANSYLKSSGATEPQRRGAMQEWSASVDVKLKNEDDLKAYLSDVEQLDGKEIETIFNAKTDSEKIENYINAITATPDEKETLAKFVSDAANGKITDYDSAIEKLPPSVQTVARAITEGAFGNLNSLKGLVLSIDKNGDITVKAHADTDSASEAVEKLKKAVNKSKKAGTIIIQAEASSAVDAQNKAKDLDSTFKGLKTEVNGKKIVMKAKYNDYVTAKQKADSLASSVNSLPTGAKTLTYTVKYETVGKKPKEGKSRGLRASSMPRKRIHFGSAADGANQTGGKTQHEKRLSDYYDQQSYGIAREKSSARAEKNSGNGKLGPRGMGGGTLTGERGPELVWEPKKSRSYIVGNGGPEIVDLPKDATVYTAQQTKQILRGHPQKEFGSADSGTIGPSDFVDNSGMSKKKKRKSSRKSKSSSSGSKSGSKSKNSKSKSKSKDKKSKGKKGSGKDGTGTPSVSPTSVTLTKKGQKSERIEVTNITSFSVRGASGIKIVGKKKLKGNKGEFRVLTNRDLTDKTRRITVTCHYTVKKGKGLAKKTKKIKVTVKCEMWENPYSKYTAYDERTETRSTARNIASTNQERRETQGNYTTADYRKFAKSEKKRSENQIAADQTIQGSAEKDILTKATKSKNNNPGYSKLSKKGKASAVAKAEKRGSVSGKYYSWSETNGFTQNAKQLKALRKLQKTDKNKGEAVEKEISEIQKLDDYYKKARESIASENKNIAEYNKELRQRNMKDAETLIELQSYSKNSGQYKQAAKATQDAYKEKLRSLETQYSVDLSHLSKTGMKGVGQGFSKPFTSEQTSSYQQSLIDSADTDYDNAMLAGKDAVRNIANFKKQEKGILGSLQQDSTPVAQPLSTQVAAQPSSNAKSKKKTRKSSSKKSSKPTYTKLTLKNYKKQASKTELSKIKKSKSDKDKQKTIDKLNSARKAKAAKKASSKKTSKKSAKRNTKKKVKLTLKNYKKSATASERKKIDACKTDKQKLAMIKKINKANGFGSTARGSVYGKVGPNGNGGLTLTGELGSELVWIPSSSSSFVVGESGPEMVDLPKDAVVYTAEETKKIFDRKTKTLAGSHAKKSKKKAAPKKAAPKKAAPKKAAPKKAAPVKKSAPAKKSSSRKSSAKKSSSRKSSAKRSSAKRKSSSRKKTSPKKRSSSKRKTAKRRPSATNSAQTAYIAPNTSDDEYVEDSDPVMEDEAQDQEFTYFNFDAASGKTYMTDEQQAKFLAMSESAQQEILSAKEMIDKQGTAITDAQIAALDAVEKRLEAQAQNKTNFDNKELVEKTYGFYTQISQQVESLQDEREKLSTTYENALSMGTVKVGQANTNLEKQKDLLLKEQDANNKIISQVQADLIKKGTKQISTQYDANGQAIGGVNMHDYVTVSDNGEVTVTDAQKEKLKAMAGDPRTKAQADLIEQEISDMQELSQKAKDASKSNDEIAQQMLEIAQRMNGWVNQYKYAYNWTQKINGLLTKRNRLEAEYENLKVQRALRGEGAASESQSITDAQATRLNQIASYKESANALQGKATDLQAQLEAVLSGAADVNGNVDANGNRIGSQLAASFRKYLTIDTTNGTVQVDNAAVDRDIKNTDEGEAFQNYVESVQGIVSDISSNIQDQVEISTQMYGLYEEDLKNYNEMVTSITSAIIDSRNKLIDSQSSMSEAITNADSKMLDSLQKAISKQRQERENKKTEKDLNDQRKKLAYMQLDTSGGNLVQSQELQKSIEESEENYTDQLIDQKISELQEQNATAQTQREEQISLLQAQLAQDMADGTITQQALNLLNNAAAGSQSAIKDIQALLNPSLTADGVLQSAKQLEQTKKDTNTSITTATTGLGTTLGLQKDSLATSIQDNLVGGEGSMSANFKSDLDLASQNAQTAFSKDSGQLSSDIGTLKSAAEQKIETTNSNTGTISTNVTSIQSIMAQKAKEEADAAAKAAEAERQRQAEEQRQREAQAAAEEAERQRRAAINWKNEAFSTTLKNILPYTEKKSVSASDNYDSSLQKNMHNLTGLVFSDLAARNARAALQSYGLSESEFSAFLINAISGADWGKSAGSYNGYLIPYATGGLNTQTGPAWLDGTYSKPELVLNAQDTANFLELKDVLRHNNLESITQNGQNGSNLYYKIDINVDKIADGYDVDKIAKRVEQRISQASGYRNINAIKKMR